MELVERLQRETGVAARFVCEPTVLAIRPLEVCSCTDPLPLPLLTVGLRFPVNLRDDEQDAVVSLLKASESDVG
jgi:hypothetical protein